MNAFIFCTADFQLFAVCFLIVSRNVLGRKFEVPNETVFRAKADFSFITAEIACKINQFQHTKTSKITGERGTTRGP